MHNYIRLTVLALAACQITAAIPAAAAPSTSQGQISVAQVLDMVEKAPKDATARNVLTAYLGGLGEAAGMLVSLKPGSCAKSLSLDANRVRQVLANGMAAGRQVETAATPIILRDMLDRAGCRD